MKLLLQSHSTYPREDACSAAAYDPATFPAATAVSSAHGSRREAIEDAVREQERLGLDVLTNGQPVWWEPLSSAAPAVDGVRVDSLGDWSQPGYCPQLSVTGRLRRRCPLTLDDFLTARDATERPVKPVLPGPYTLARACVTRSELYPTFADLAFAWSDIFAAEVADLAGAGASVIQIEEPAILSHPSDMRLLRRLLEPLWAARGAAQLVLATYLGDATPLYAQLNSLPVDILALDLPSSAGLGELIAETGASKELALGVVDGRDPQLEHPTVLARSVEKTLKRYALEAVHLLPSCGLHHLPRERARRKLALLAETRQLLAPAA